MEKLVLDVIAKVREMYKYDKDYSKILSGKARISVDLIGNRLELMGISFGTYDEVNIYKDKIVSISEDRKNKRILCEYNDYEELLNM